MDIATIQWDFHAVLPCHLWDQVFEPDQVKMTENQFDLTATKNGKEQGEETLEQRQLSELIQTEAWKSIACLILLHTFSSQQPQQAQLV